MLLCDLFLIEGPKTKNRPTAADIQRILKMREAIRHDEGAGGQCGFVAEWIHRTFGWEAHSGVYTDPNDDPIIDHVWNVLPDGAVLDATADQIGEGHDIRIVEPSDPDHRRYRWEWTDDFNPDTDPHEAMGREWNGETDVDRMDRLRAERGQHWWLKDRTHIDAYLQKEKGYGRNG